MKLSSRGVALQVTFSIGRTGKRIIWEQSKRLITGTLIALSPASDMFQTKALIATVAARPLAALQQNPPEIELFIGNVDEIEIDPSVEWIMVQGRAGFYEADRHILVALQRMMIERYVISARPTMAVQS